MEPIKLFVLHDEKQNKLIAEIETPLDAPMRVGAVSLETDGNYIKHIAYSGISEERLKEWWNWVLGAGHVEMSEEFPFEPEDIKIKRMIFEK